MADNVLEEVVFGWPRQRASIQLKEHLALNLQRAINWVCVLCILNNIPCSFVALFSFHLFHFPFK